MRGWFLVGVVTAGFGAAPAVALANGRTLDDCFAAALTRAEAVNVQVESIKQAEEHVSQAHGAMLPNVQGLGSYTVQQQPKGANANITGPGDQPLAKITATQPLFRGFRDFATLRQDEKLVNASKLDRDAAVLQVYKDVVQAFYNVMTAESDLSDIRTEMQLFDNRIKELKKFQKIGRSRLSEVLTAQSALASLKATERQTIGVREAAREVMTVLTGFDSTEPYQDTAAETAVQPEPLPNGLGKIDARPEVVAATARVNVADEGISIARGQHYPSLDLNGDYFLVRTGPDKDITWDVQLAMTVPIYSGGIIESQVKEAVSKKRQGEDQMLDARHAAEQEIRTVHAQVVSDIDQIKELAAATDLAKRSFEDLTREYRLGLVTNLDVLTAMQTYEEAQRSLDHMKLTLKGDREHYEAAVVRRPAGFQLSGKP